MKLLPFSILSVALPLTTALPNDYIGLGHLISQNASYIAYPEQIKTAGCITDSFHWTVNTSSCGLFSSQRGKFYKKWGHYQYVLKSQYGLCGLGEQDEVVCGKWTGEGPGPLNGTDDGKGAGGKEIGEDARKVAKEGSWWAMVIASLPSEGNELRFTAADMAFQKWWSDGYPTGSRDASLWNNIDDVHPVGNVTLNQYDVGVRIFWEAVPGV